MRRENRTSKAVSAVLVVSLVALSGLGAYLVNQTILDSSPLVGSAVKVATSSFSPFVGAVGNVGYLYVGLLNGTVVKMEAQSGKVVKSVALPDQNSAAHLVYYNDSVYVGTEKLPGAKDTGPYHVYRIDSQTMQIAGQMAMNLHEANGFLLAFNGYLWAGDGQCTLYKIAPRNLTVVKMVPNVAEDEMAFDGQYYWTQCVHSVHVLKADSTLSSVAAGVLTGPGRPRGFFILGSSTYCTDTANFTRHRMLLSGHTVMFSRVGSFLDQAIGTRDAFSLKGLLYFYETRDDRQVPGRIIVYDGNQKLEVVVNLFGYGLPTDASQHSMFLLDGRIYFVTPSVVGYLLPFDAQAV
ncbi:MAG: hypothetical protein OK438_02015 [Thaumarchaeota archaeon]|nr:hypothetical protein [Nitrososphaerota archaeon]